MKTLIYGAGPIGQWLTLRLAKTAADVTLLARGETHRSLAENGIEIVDGLTGERHSAPVDLVERLAPEQHYDLVVVAMQKAGRLAVCPVLAANRHLENVLFLGNDVSGFHRYLDYLPADKVLLGFPGAGGGWHGEDLVIMDREGVIFKKGGDLRAVAAEKELIHQYCRACREAGDVLRDVGYRRRQPPVFNLYYWLPRWLEPPVFKKLFSSRAAEVRFGLHAPGVAPELLEMAAEFADLKAAARVATPTLDALLDCVAQPALGGER